MNCFDKNYNGLHNMMPLMVMTNGQVVYQDQTRSSKMEHCLQAMAWEVDSHEKVQFGQVLLVLAVLAAVIIAGLSLL